MTSALSQKRDWPRLKTLWDGVVAKRKKHDNDVWKLEKDNPGAISPKTVLESKERLLDTLKRVKEFADDIGGVGEATKYEDMTRRVQNGRKA